MNNKNNPEKCETKLCCKATANLQIQVEQELTVEDGDICDLLNKQRVSDEDTNAKE